jgi:hypothetical protein
LPTAAVLISFGAVLGKTTPLQLVIMGLIETAIFAGNEHLGLNVFKVSICFITSQNGNYYCDRSEGILIDCQGHGRFRTCGSKLPLSRQAQSSINETRG